MAVRKLGRRLGSAGPDGWGWRLASLALYASFVADLVVLLRPTASRFMPPAVGMTFGLYGLLGTGFAVRAYRHRNLDRRTRQAWGVMALALLLLLGSSMLRSSYPIGTEFPSPADILRLLVGPVLLVGLLKLPMRTQGRRERQKVWLDTGVVVIASSMLLWFLQIGPSAVARNVGSGALAAALAYPAADLVLIFGAAVVLFRGAADSARQPARLLGVAMLALVVGDTLLGYRQSRGASMGADQWQYACWLTGHFMLTMAAFAQCRQAGRHALTIEAPRARSVTTLPYIAIGLSYLLLLLAVRGMPVRLVGLVAGGMAITVVVVIRQVLASRENHELAITDPLTRLYNRQQLHDTLRLALARGARGAQPTCALLLDLNGFKQINDTMGHAAGDQLLVAFARMLRRSVVGSGAVGRLGGDEFAIVLPEVRTTAEAQAVVDRIVAELQDPVPVDGIMIQLRASVGIAVSGPGELSSDELLHRADIAMYQAKAATRQTGTTSFAHYDATLPADAAARTVETALVVLRS